MYSKEEEKFLATTKSIQAYPIGIAVALSLLNPTTHYEIRYMYLQFLHDKVDPTQVFFTNLRHVVEKLRDDGDEAFARSNSLPGAEWGQDGKLINAAAFWPDNYELPDLKDDVRIVRDSGGR